MIVITFVIMLFLFYVLIDQTVADGGKAKYKMLRWTARDKTLLVSFPFDRAVASHSMVVYMRGNHVYTSEINADSISAPVKLPDTYDSIGVYNDIVYTTRGGNVYADGRIVGPGTIRGNDYPLIIQTHMAPFILSPDDSLMYSDAYRDIMAGKPVSDIRLEFIS